MRYEARSELGGSNIAKVDKGSREPGFVEWYSKFEGGIGKVRGSGSERIHTNSKFDLSVPSSGSTGKKWNKPRQDQTFKNELLRA